MYNLTCTFRFLLLFKYTSLRLTFNSNFFSLKENERNQVNLHEYTAKFGILQSRKLFPHCIRSIEKRAS